MAEQVRQGDEIVLVRAQIFVGEGVTQAVSSPTRDPLDSDNLISGVCCHYESRRYNAASFNKGTDNMRNALVSLRGSEIKTISLVCSFVVAFSVVLHSEMEAFAAQPMDEKDTRVLVGEGPKVATTLNESVLRNIARNPSRVEFETTQLQAETRTSSGGKNRRLGGALIGAAVGIGVGFLIADISDYPLKEGGGYGVIIMGSAIGGLVGYKTATSMGKDWSQASKTLFSLRGAWTASRARQNIRDAFTSEGYFSFNARIRHPYSPAFSITREIRNNLSVGGEIAGISAQEVHNKKGIVTLTEHVNGACYGLIVSYEPRTTRQRRLTYALAGGMDYYSVPVGAGFGYLGVNPMEQPSYAFVSKYHGLGLQLKGGMQYAVVRDVSLQAGVVGHWAGSVKMRNIAISDPANNLFQSLPGHSVNLSSVHCYVGVGMRFGGK